MSGISVLSPLGINMTEAQRASDRLTSLDGAGLGVLTNNTPNVDLLLNLIVEQLSGRFKIRRVLRKRKANPSVPAEGLDEFARECEVVISAIGD